MGIKNKLLNSFLLIISSLLISGIFFVSINHIVLSKYVNLNNNMVSEYSLIEDVSSLILSYDRLIKEPDNNFERKRFEDLYKQLEVSLVEIDKNIVSYESKIAFRGLKNNIISILIDIKNGLNYLDQGDYLEAINYQTLIYNKKDFVQDNTVNLILKELEYSKNLQIEISKIGTVSRLIAILVVLIILIFCVWYIFSFSNKFVAPLVSLTDASKSVKDGDFDISIDNNILTGDDEVSVLANSFNTMIVHIKNDIRKLEKNNIEIKDSRDKLEEEKQKLQKYLNVAGVFVLIFDSNNNVLLINKKGCEILTINPSDIIGEDWIKAYVLKKDQEKTKTILASLFSGVVPFETLENIMVSKNGFKKNIVWHFSPLENKKGLPQAILATGVDVTELTKAKITIDQLKELNRLKNEVLNIATHELRTPLVSIIGLSEVMKNNPKTISEEYQSYISIINKEGSKLANLIKTMLTASRNEISKASVDKEKFDLVDLIKSFQTPLSLLVKKTESKIKFNLGKEKVIINSDKAKISQVIYNLVENAIKYGSKKQTININLFALNKNYIRVEVKNEGKGIPKSIQKNLFHKFSQLEPSLSRSQDGMGLGLYICRQNIENLGGEIGVESETNKGITFYFTLPLI